VALHAALNAADRRQPEPHRPARRDPHRARRHRHPDHQGEVARGRDVRPRLRACARPPVATRDASAHRLGPLGRGLRRGGARQRQVPACARRQARGQRAVGECEPADEGDRQRLHGWHQCLLERRDEGAPARVRRARPAARAMDARRHAGLGNHDGVGPRRQLEHRAAAHAACADSAGRAHQRAAAAIPGREAACHRRLRGAVPRAANRRQARYAGLEFRARVRHRRRRRHRS